MLILARMVKDSVVMVSVINDLESDQRVSKVCNTLSASNFKVQLVGRLLPNSHKDWNSTHTFKRFNLLINKGPLFYIGFNMRLFFYLLFKKFDVLWANDLDTLPANYLLAKIRGKKLVYDSHEYFTEVPELINRPFKQSIWKWVERVILPNLKNCFTVSEHIADAYNKQYNTNFKVVRNFPKKHPLLDRVGKESYLIYQGALNVGRGLEELILAMKEVEGNTLMIAGAGDIEKELKILVHENGLSNKVEFLGRVSPEALFQITKKAKLGFSLEKDLGLSYRFAVPNKIFDYIQAQVPVLYAPLIEVKTILKEYKIGLELKSHHSTDIAQQINEMLNSPEYENWIFGCKKAAEELNWEHEENKLKEIIQSLD